MPRRSANQPLRFAAVTTAAAFAGWLWNLTGLPLGWLMGAALVTGTVVLLGHDLAIPKPLHRAALVTIGTGVGLAITPEVALSMFGWLPIMVAVSFTGILLAALFTPLLARFGRMAPATAYFSLMPGGLIEMANIGGKAGADRVTIAALHTIRVALIVGVLPLVLFAIYPHDTAAQGGSAVLTALPLLAAWATGLAGGYLGHRARLPAAWLLGAVLAVGILSGSGLVTTPGATLPPALIVVAQIVVGMSLGARFERDRLASIPRALMVGLPVLICIMILMALLAVLADRFVKPDAPALVLAFSIGGMAEMVLTAKALHQDVALVAAFQAVRGVIVNLSAGAVWARLNPIFSNDQEGNRP